MTTEDELTILKNKAQVGAGIAVASVIGTGTMAMAGKNGVEYADKAAAARIELASIEQNAQISLIREGFGYLPSRSSKELVTNAAATIDKSSIALAIPKEQICNLKSLRELSPQLDDACVVVVHNQNLEEHYNAYLVPTNYSEVKPYQNVNLGREIVQPVVGILVSMGLSALAIYSLGRSSYDGLQYFRAKRQTMAESSHNLTNETVNEV